MHYLTNILPTGQITNKLKINSGFGELHITLKILSFACSQSLVTKLSISGNMYY